MVAAHRPRLTPPHATTTTAPHVVLTHLVPPHATMTTVYVNSKRHRLVHLTLTLVQ
jgi:hypothetical protein